ncbi:uncharacterized protein LOC124408303 [Diprion similis]|uniref:uncharacterized protein LOC124408303 n=1 Tax=Diprion similis TaxID=362088 RepID=UPI001EF7A52B|nr:uncharacterized protein LOC124408303 [Diprion similis]
MDETMTRDCTVSKKSTVEYLIESKIQGHLLNTVKEEHTRVKDFVEKLRQTASDMKMVENTYGITKVRADEMLCRISTLEADLHRQQTQLNIVKHLRDKSEMELQRCTNIFYDTKYVVACALRVRKMNDTGKDILEMGDRQLMLCLFDILNKAVTERWKNRTPSSATVHFPQEAYKIGDLGIKVSHVELRKTRMSRQRKSSRLSTLKILASLGVRLSGTSFSKSKIIPENLENSDEAEEFENSINEEADKSNRESSISLGSQEEDLEQKLITVETVDDEETEVDREDESELEEMKLKPEEQLPDNDDEKQDEFDKNQEIAVKNEKGESTVGTAEAGEASSNQIDVPE